MLSGKSNFGVLSFLKVENGVMSFLGNSLYASVAVLPILWIFYYLKSFIYIFSRLNRSVDGKTKYICNILLELDHGFMPSLKQRKYTDAFWHWKYKISLHRSYRFFESHIYTRHTRTQGMYPPFQQFALQIWLLSYNSLGTILWTIFWHSVIFLTLRDYLEGSVDCRFFPEISEWGRHSSRWRLDVCYMIRFERL